jgi:hypothetical protein
VTTTVNDHDLVKTSKLVRLFPSSPPSLPTSLTPLLPQLRAVYLGIGMMFLHPYLKYTQHVFVQAPMGIRNLHNATPVAILVLGKLAEWDLKRPLKAGGLFGCELVFCLIPRTVTFYCEISLDIVGGVPGVYCLVVFSLSPSLPLLISSSELRPHAR